MDAYEKKNLLKSRRKHRGYQRITGSYGYRAKVGKYGILIKAEALAMLMGAGMGTLSKMYERGLIPKPIKVDGGSYRVDVGYIILTALWLSLIPIEGNRFMLDEELFTYLLKKRGVCHDENRENDEGFDDDAFWARV